MERLKGSLIPDDISLVAFDNFPYSPTVTPSPTVIDIDMFSLGTHAGNLLLKKFGIQIWSSRLIQHCRIDCIAIRLTHNLYHKH